MIAVGLGLCDQRAVMVQCSLALLQSEHYGLPSYIPVAHFPAHLWVSALQVVCHLHWYVLEKSIPTIS